PHARRRDPGGVMSGTSDSGRRELPLGMSPEAYELALASRPRHRDDVASVEVSGGTILWSAHDRPVLLTLASHAAWPHFDGVASPAELATPDSCVGQRLHLDREAETVSLILDGKPYAVRTEDPSLAAWLRERATPTEVTGPTVAFVVTDDAPGRKRRYGLYDQ